MTELSCVIFSVPLDAAEAVGNLLTEEGRGIELRDADSTPPPPANTVELRVWLASVDVERRVKQVEGLLSSLGEMGITASPWEHHSEPVQPEEWQEAYKAYFSTTRIGRCFVIKPSWEEYKAEPDDQVIELDPGMAFGTGLHPSTQLVLHALERVARSGPPPTRVLDLGCGSGILAIAAAKLWPGAEIIAVDNDEGAVQVCRENCARNGLEERVQVLQRAASSMDGKFGVILANINPEVLAEIQPALSEMIDDFGRIVLSGLIAEQAKQMSRIYAKDLTLEPEFTEEIDGWRSVLFRLRE